LNINKEFIEYFFPEKSLIKYKNPRIPYANNVIFKNLIMYGFPGSGKTVLANSLVGIALDKYGKRNVNARISEEGDLTSLLNRCLEPKLINILFSDNTTLVKQDKQTLIDYFRMRNIFYDRFKRSNGYIFSILSLHRFHSIPIELRTCMDGLLIRDTSLNPYDKNILKNFIGNEELFKFMELCSDKRIKQRNLMNISIFIGRTFKGLLNIPPEDRYLFKSAPSLLEMLQEEALENLEVK
jgi:hypothetical protein